MVSGCLFFGAGISGSSIPKSVCESIRDPGTLTTTYCYTVVGRTKNAFLSPRTSLAAKYGGPDQEGCWRLRASVVAKYGGRTKRAFMLPHASLPAKYGRPDHKGKLVTASLTDSEVWRARPREHSCYREPHWQRSMAGQTEYAVLSSRAALTTQHGGGI